MGALERKLQQQHRNVVALGCFIILEKILYIYLPIIVHQLLR